MNKVMNLTLQQIERDLTGLVDAELLENSAQLVETFARATFSVLAEPGDRFAGWLLSRFSPAQVVECLQAGFAFQRLIDAEHGELLREQFGDLEDLYAAARERWAPRLNYGLVSAAFESGRRVKAKLLSPLDELWPESLNDLEAATPHCLWLRGEPRLMALSGKSLSLVGSRLASSYGALATTEIVTAGVSNNLTIISGGAYGIDAIAHRATLAIEGFTIAVLAGGIDRLYPAGNADLLNQMAKENLLVAEQPPGSSPTKWRFLQRNRLIAALGSATVVIEAGARSGALNTANHANLISRAVGAVPGRFDSPQSVGCHELIRAGKAVLVANAQQAIELAIPSGPSPLQPFADTLGHLEVRLLDSLSNRATNLEQIAFKSGLTVQEISVALGGLQLRGLVAPVNGGWVKLSKVEGSN